MASRRTQQAAGVATGVAVGGASSAVIGYGLNKTLAAGAGLLARSAPRAAAVLVPGAGWVAGGVIVGSSLYGAYKAGKQVAQSGGSVKSIAAAAGLGALGISPAVAQSITQPAPVPRPEPWVRPGEEPRRKSGGGQQTASSKQGGGKQAKTAEPIKPNAAPPSAPAQSVPAPQTAAAPVSSYDQRRKALEDEAAQLRKVVEKESATGYGKKAQAATERLKQISAERGKIDAEEMAASPFRQGLAIGLPVGALLAGGLIGNMIGKSGVKAAEQSGTAAAKEVEKLGRQAAKLAASSPKGVIAGTPAGDKAKAIVNQAYAMGGAKSAFPSPGYPSPPTPKQLFSEPAGKPGALSYAIPAFNMAAGAAEIGASFAVDDPNVRTVLRTTGAMEASMGFFQYKALANATGVRPAATAVAAIEGLRNRVMREAGGKRPAGVAQIAAGAAVDRARIQAGREVGVAAARAGAAVGSEAARAGGRVGVAAAKAQESVAKAQSRAARAGAQAQRGPQYKDTWTDKNGKIYTRRDMSVRSASGSGRKTVH